MPYTLKNRLSVLNPIRRLSVQTLEERLAFYSVALGGGLPIHEDFTQFGYALFGKQFGKSDLDSIANVIDELRDGAHDEDDGNQPEPFGDDSPSLRHFWVHDAAYQRTLGDGLLGFESAPARAIRILGLDGGIANLFNTNAAQVARYLGHVAHLLQDVTVPAHAHSDTHYDGSVGFLNLFTDTDFDPYHDYVDGIEFSTVGVFRVDTTYVASFIDGARTRHIGFAAPVLIGDGDDLRDPASLPVFEGDALAGLFFENATAAAAYDTKDYVGSATQVVNDQARGTTANADREFDPPALYSSFSQAELIAQASVLVPQAVRSTAELFRYFYGLTDTDAPEVFLPKLSSNDPDIPQAFPSGRIELIAAATDQDDNGGTLGSDSGVGKDLFKFEAAVVNPDGSLGPWQELTAEDSGAFFDDGGAQFGADLAGKHGATARAALDASSGSVFAVRAFAEDGSGKLGTSEIFYVRYGEPGITEITVIDRSGSMQGDPLAAAIASASAELGTRNDFDRIGVISFSSSATVRFPLTTIQPGSQVREQAQQTIITLTADGTTSIGAGLLAAVGLLPSNPPPEDGRGQTSIVVLTDGMENTSPYIADVVDQIPGYVTVHGIALGSAADAQALQKLARDRGGQFFAAADSTDLSSVYARASGAVTGEQDVARTSGTVAPGGQQIIPFQVDATAGSITVGLTWPGSDLNLTVVGPDGRVYTHADPGAGRFTIGETAEFFRLPAAAAGNWLAYVDAIDVAAGGERFEVFARIGTPLVAEILTPTQTLLAGESLPIRLRLTNGAPIVGATVQAFLIPPNPAATASSVSLFDDGTHGDATAGDGVYSNASLVGAFGSGVYTLLIEATGEGFVRAPSQLLLVSGEAPQPPVFGSISGFVYVDVNNNGQKDVGELGLANVPISLVGSEPFAVTSGVDGSYSFPNLPAGVYGITQTQPSIYNDGSETLGTPALGRAENNGFVDIAISTANINLVNYNFGERGLIAALVSKRLFLASTPTGSAIFNEIELPPNNPVVSFLAPANGTFTAAGGEAEGISFELYTSAGTPVSLGQRGRFSAEVTAGEQYLLLVRLTGDERVNLTLALDPGYTSAIGYFTNRLNRHDADLSGAVTNLDAFRLISELRAHGASVLHAPSNLAAITLCLDVSGDNQFTNLDVFQLVAKLRAHAQPTGEGEGFDDILPSLSVAMIAAEESQRHSSFGAQYLVPDASYSEICSPNRFLGRTSFVATRSAAPSASLALVDQALVELPHHRAPSDDPLYWAGDTAAESDKDSSVWQVTDWLNDCGGGLSLSRQRTPT